MARSLSDLHELMGGIEDVEKAYIQPPSSGMVYPCIVIERGLPSNVKHADDIKYVLYKGYTITVVDRDPTSLIPDRVEALPHCTFDRFFKANGLNHFVFQLFF